MICVDADFHGEINEIKGNSLAGEPLKQFLQQYLPLVDAKKRLGVLYPIIMEQKEADHLIEQIFGSKLTRKEAIAVAYHIISAEEEQMSQYGDAQVTESLNYFRLPNDTIRAYHKTLD